jgi:hypothetical protein
MRANREKSRSVFYRRVSQDAGKKPNKSFADLKMENDFYSRFVIKLMPFFV